MRKKVVRYSIGLVVLWVLLLGACSLFREEEKSTRTWIRERVLEQFPEEAAEGMLQFGVFPYQSGVIASEKIVLLLHGLDEPGRIWLDLQPVLSENGFAVAEFRYPNDQSVYDSSQMLQKVMEELAAKGVQEVILVGHSMGGLVIRGYLTLPQYLYAEKSAKEELPKVEQVVMIGTPNHGSEWSRLRGFLEIRNQVSRMWEQEWHWLDGFLDGAGEAKIDILPNSEFLSSLHKQAWPEDIELRLIAGLWQADSNWTDDKKSFVQQWSEAFGDGVVPLDSVRISGVKDFHIVEGNHFSILRNYGWQEERIPPAIPLVLDFLRNNNKPL